MADATLTFSILAKDQASRTFNSIGKAASGFGKTLAGAGKAGVAGLAVVGIGLATLGPQLLDAAANLQLMENKSKIVFGNQIGRVTDWADANAHAMGLTKREAVGLAAGFGDLLIPMGFNRKEAAGMSTDVIGLSGALAQWSGGTRTATEVADILSAAMLGERDALQGLGISISQAEVDAKLLSKGQQDLTGKMRQQAEAIATQELLFEKSTDAQKAFADGGGTLASKLAGSKARLKEMGETLLVAVTPALISLADAVSKNVLPKLEGFVNWLVGPGKFQIAAFFLDATVAGLDFAQSFIGWLRSTSQTVFAWADNVLGAMEAALGWHPVWGEKLRSARKNFGTFAAGVDSSLADADAAVGGWNLAAKNMRDRVVLKGNIADLEQKLATARNLLKDKNLTKERRAQVTATIAQLESQIRSARRQLDNIPDENVNIVANYVGVSVSGQNRRQQDRARAHGGPVWPGDAFQVGERGRELFVPGRAGEIVANSPLRLAEMMAGTMRQPVASGVPLTVVLHNHGVIGSRLELENWMTGIIGDLRRQGRI